MSPLVTWIERFLILTGIGDRFLKAPYYETDVAEFAEANKQPFAVAEALTGGIPPPPFNFTGPVLVRENPVLSHLCDARRLTKYSRRL